MLNHNRLAIVWRMKWNNACVHLAIWEHHARTVHQAIQESREASIWVFVNAANAMDMPLNAIRNTASVLTVNTTPKEINVNDANPVFRVMHDVALHTIVNRLRHDHLAIATITRQEDVIRSEDA